MTESCLHLILFNKISGFTFYYIIQTEGYHTVNISLLLYRIDLQIWLLVCQTQTVTLHAHM